MNRLKTLQKVLADLANPQQAEACLWFFKTGKGQYGYGDKFLGIKVPVQRKVAKSFKDLSLEEIEKLLASDIHEHRQIALYILVLQFNSSDEKMRKQMYQLYLKNTQRVNNWDLVDCSAPYIVGMYLLHKPRKILYKLAKSKNLWEKRIAIIATFAFIRAHDFTDTLKISEILLHDTHDLIHKAVGWMLREVGNRDVKAEEKFLQQYYKSMPRTMLRYAIEKFSEPKRRFYLKK